MPVRGASEVLAAGSQVLSGVIRRGAFVRVLRGRRAVATAQIRGLQLQNKPVEAVRAGRQCAVIVEPLFDFEAGDFLEVFELVEEGASPAGGRQ